MDSKTMLRKLHNGDRVYGTMIASESPNWPSAVRNAGLDFVFIDSEHISQDRQKLAWMCKLYEAVGVAPIVRIPKPDPYWACMALDGGAAGIIAPYVESPDQVRELVGAVKFRPLKGQVLRDRVYEGKALPGETEAYLKARNAGKILIVNIESTPAMANLEEIVQVEGLDAVLVGPHDLTTSLGIPEQYAHPRFVKAVDTIITTARNAGIGGGIHATYGHALEHEIRWGKLGMNLFVHWTDLTAFYVTLRDAVSELKSALDGAVDVVAKKEINI